MRAGELGAGDAALPLRDEIDALLMERRADAGGGPVSCGPDPSPLSELHLSVRTASVGGRFRPKNAGAIWIEDEGGAWVKTLERWGLRRAKWLTVFNAASDGDVTDAITSATLEMHTVHELTWDLTDVHGCEVPSGRYALRLEITDQSRTGVNTSIPFEKSDEPSTQSPSDVMGFRDMTLRLE